MKNEEDAGVLITSNPKKKRDQFDYDEGSIKIKKNDLLSRVF